MKHKGLKSVFGEMMCLREECVEKVGGGLL